MRKIIFSIVLFLSIVFTGNAQKDTVFWFAAPDISAGLGESPVFLRFMTYSSGAIVTISQPANGGFAPILRAIPANSVDSVNITAFLFSIENNTAASPLNNGLKITSTQPIGAYYEVKSTLNHKETASLKGSKALGTEFYTPFPTFWATGTTTPKSFSSIEVIATQNATTLLITPRTAVIGPYPANVSYTVALNEGQTYCIRDTNSTAATSLAGSIVSSDKPVALTLHSGAMNQGGTFSTNLDQITNSSYIGNDYVIRKGTGSNERVYILATQNNTNIDIIGASTANVVVNWSETKEYVLTDTVTYIKTSKPVYVWHVTGHGNKMSGAQVPNLLCAGTYTTNVVRTSSDSFALVLTVRSGFENMFTINGNASLVPASAFAPVPGTSGAFVCAKIDYSTSQIGIGTPVIIANSGDVFGAAVMQGTMSTGSEYSYFSEFTSQPFVNAGTDAVICANGTVNLNGFVGGGTVTGTWSGSGFGSFQNGVTSLSNVYIPSDLDTAISPITIILSSTGPCPVKRDTITIDVNPRPIVSASADQVICANNGVVQLNGSVLAGSTTGIWSVNGTGSFSASNTDLNAVYTFSTADTSNGSLQFVLSATNIGTCNAESDTMMVTITDAPIVEAGPPTISVCANNPLVTLNGVVQGPSGTGKWTTIGTGIFNPNNTQLNTSFQPSQTDINNGQTTVYLSSTNNGNCLVEKDSIQVFFTPSPVANAGNNGFACSNNANLNLAGVVSGATATGYWSGGTGTFSPDSSALTAVYTPTASEISAGIIQLTLTTTNNGGCTAVTDNVQFNFVTPPFSNYSVNNVCLNGTNNFNDFSLQGFGSITSWQYDYGNGNTSTQANSTFVYASPGTYTTSLIVTSSVGCSDTSQRVVTIYPNPVSNFVDTLTCQGTFILVDFTDQSSIGTPDTITTWLWDFGGSGGSTSQNPTNIYTNQGNYQVTLTVVSNHNCSNSSIQLINIPTHPDAAFYYNTTPGFNVGATVTFIDSSSNASTYAWDFGNGDTSMAMNVDYTYFSNGTYNIVHVVSDNIGCTDTAYATLIITSVTDEITSLIPNAISPNGDGKNDVWKLPFVSVLYPKSTVEIFNNWGQQIFYSEGYESAWDGTFRGEQLPMGNYYFILDLKDDKHPDPYKGAILLVR